MSGPCTCVAGGGGETILPRPTWLPAGERVNGVPVDPCIADTIRALWAAGVQTLGSCCGHNAEPPSVVLAEGHLSNWKLAWIHGVISTVDARSWQLHQWQLVKLPGGAS